MRKEPFIVDLREYHNNYKYLMPGPSGSGISNSLKFRSNATGQSKAVDDFIDTIKKSFISNTGPIFSGTVRGILANDVNDILDGDIVLVDREKRPTSGCIGVYLCNGVYVLKSLELNCNADLWGVVVYVLSGI